MNLVTHLKDTLGNNYLGISIPNDIVQPYLNELKEILGEEYNKFIDNQIKRDNGHYHITVVNVMDYNRLIKEMGITYFTNFLEVVLSFPIDDLNLLGLGKAEKNNNKAFFIVCESDKLDAIRTRCNLPKQDFHITLGFSEKDVFGVWKNELLKSL